jgi:DNA-binding NarL/FixJ family response regulator
VTRVFVLAESEEAALDLATLLGEDDRFEVVSATAPAGTSVAMIRATRPDVLLASRISEAEIPDASVPIVLLTDDANEAWDFRSAVKARLPIHITPLEAFGALIAAAQSLTVLTSAQADTILNVAPAPQPARPMPEALTPRETQVLRMMAEGMANKEIADHLGISDHTAKFHVASILAKLQAGSRAQAVTIGIRTGLIPI